MKDVLVSVRYLTAEGESVEVPAEQLDLSYRHSIFEKTAAASSRQSSTSQEAMPPTSAPGWTT